MTFQSEMINELAISLSKAQANIKVAIEDKKNPHFKSSYASLNSIWEACRDAITNEGLSVIQTTEPENDCLYLVTTLMHSSGQWIKSKLPISSNAVSPQQLGSAITYFRRYSLASIVGVAPGEEDDAESIKSDSIPVKTSPKKLSEPEILNFKKKFNLGCDSEHDKYIGVLCDKLKKNTDEMIICAAMNEEGFIRAFDAWRKSAIQKNESQEKYCETTDSVDSGSNSDQ